MADQQTGRYSEATAAKLSQALHGQQPIAIAVAHPRAKVLFASFTGVKSAVSAKKSLIARLKGAYIKYFRSYGISELTDFLKSIGIHQGDTVIVHSSWQSTSGFTGNPAQFCAALRDAVGPTGLVVMPSLTYHNMSSAEFLASGKPMNVRRSPSAMGLLSEVFRRGKGVVRSLSPTHPLLAWGRDAESFIEGHENTEYSFGPQSPFARLLERNALILCVDTGFASLTFTHFVEDRLAHTLSVPLYEPEPLIGTVIDTAGQTLHCPTRVLSAQANRLRREPRLVAHLTVSSALHQGRLGNTQMTWIRAADLTHGAEQLASSGAHFFDKPAAVG